MLATHSWGVATLPPGGVSHSFDATDESTATFTIGDASCVTPVK